MSMSSHRFLPACVLATFLFHPLTVRTQPSVGETSVPPSVTTSAPTSATSEAAVAPPEPASAPASAPRSVADAASFSWPVSEAAPADAYGRRQEARLLATEIAEQHQLDVAWVWQTLAQARHKPTVGKLMMPPPRGTAKNWGAYRSRFIEPIRIRAGTQFWRTHEATLKRAEAQFGVPAAVIAGVIGVETIYGRHTGNFRVLDALTTLSLDFPQGRSDRSAFFRQELGHFLAWCHDEQRDPTTVLGSYAGAIGLPQFMPSSIRRFAVDFDGDGRIDLINSPTDAIGSVAHFLAQHGWQKGLPAYYTVTPPSEADALAKLLAPDIRPTFSVHEMTELGATLPQAASNHPGPLALVQLENGEKSPTLIVGTENFYAVTRYNQSSYYALAVLQLGEALKKGLKP